MKIKFDPSGMSREQLEQLVTHQMDIIKEMQLMKALEDKKRQNESMMWGIVRVIALISIFCVGFTIGNVLAFFHAN